MAQRTWIGGAVVTAQVSRITPGGTIEAGDKFTLTLTDESGATQSLVYVATSTTVASVTAGITSAWNASTSSQFARITASDQTTYVQLTADTAGEPFYLSVATTETDDSPADAQTVATTTTTPNSGPNDYNVAANWRENAVPIATNDVLITGANSILYGLRQSSVAVADFVVDTSYTGSIGVGGAPLSIDPDSFYVHGGRTMYFNLNSAAIPAYFTGGTRSNVNGASLTTVTVSGGSVYLGGDPGDACTLTTLDLREGGTAIVGPFSTITNLRQAGGTGTLWVAATLVQAQAGTLTINGTGAITTLTNDGATVYASSTGTITTCNANAGTTDFTQSRMARTVTTLNHKRPAIVSFDTTVMTLSTYAPSGKMSLQAN